MQQDDRNDNERAQLSPSTAKRICDQNTNISYDERNGLFRTRVQHHHTLFGGSSYPTIGEAIKARNEIRSNIGLQSLPFTVPDDCIETYRKFTAQMTRDGCSPPPTPIHTAPEGSEPKKEPTITQDGAPNLLI